ncbi:hypothetical protein [Fructilactobacillus frigidiflavus]|uniref:hypothetical protein n=1 Tax=Fructilactobacillus frigidiflavus TaxID=3242688 RepID=UPI00375679E9
MKLREFQVSAQDLDQTRSIFIQTQAGIYPVTGLKFNQQKLILSSEPKQPPLTLHQFNQQTMKFDQKLALYLADSEVLRIFGYRLENNQIIFG